MNTRHFLLLLMSVPLLITTLSAPCQAQNNSEPVRNWFDDPFFQASSAIADCPLPMGPFATEAERRQQAHRRVEKGTSCWLAGQCERASAYAYDRDIERAIRDAAAQSRLFADSTLWITVQGRAVYIEGCVTSPDAAMQLEAFAKGVPFVQQAAAIVRSSPKEPVPYRTRP
jgi:hypothetical protein